MSSKNLTTIEWEELLDNSGNHFNCTTERDKSEEIIERVSNAGKWEEKQDGSRYQPKPKTKTSRERTGSSENNSNIFTVVDLENNKTEINHIDKFTSNFVREKSDNSREKNICNSWSSNQNYRPYRHQIWNTRRDSSGSPDSRFKGTVTKESQGNYGSIRHTPRQMGKDLCYSSTSHDIYCKRTNSSAREGKEDMSNFRNRRVSQDKSHFVQIPMNGAYQNDRVDSRNKIYRRYSSKSSRDRSESVEVPRKSLRTNDWEHGDDRRHSRILISKSSSRSESQEIAKKNSSVSEWVEKQKTYRNHLQNSPKAMSRGEEVQVVQWDSEDHASGDHRQGSRTRRNEEEEIPNKEWTTRRRRADIKKANKQRAAIKKYQEQERDWTALFLNATLLIFPLFLVGLILRFIIEPIYFDDDL